MVVVFNERKSRYKGENVVEHTTVSVSYTHLDVYKRQYNGGNILFNIPKTWKFFCLVIINIIIVNGRNFPNQKVPFFL